MCLGVDSCVKVKCAKCGSKIKIKFLEFEKLENDKEEITFSCKKCKKKGKCVIENSQTVVIKGAKLKKTKFLD